MTHFIKNNAINRFLTISTGVSLLYYHLSDDNKLLMALVIYLSVGAIVSLLSSKNVAIVWIICLTFICINECLVLMDQSFIRLRSHLMLLVMKIISFNSLINEESDKDHFRGTDNLYFSSIAYILHPLSLLLGVWHPLKLTKTNDSIAISLLKCFYNLFLSTIFLLLSTCLIHYYIGQTLIGHIVSFLSTFLPISLVYVLEICLTVYTTAQQFRFSHYFISFATQSMLCLWNSE